MFGVSFLVSKFMIRFSIWGVMLARNAGKRGYLIKVPAHFTCSQVLLLNTLRFTDYSRHTGQGAKA
nr:MAG TPA: hypothetical protein [Caudoviricetes sp.]